MQTAPPMSAIETAPGGIATPTHRRIEQRADHLSHRRHRERHGNPVVIEFGKAGDDSLDMVGGVALPGGAVGPCPLAPRGHADVIVEDCTRWP